MAKKPSPIPLKLMLAAIDTNDFDFYSRLTPDQQKEFSPWLAMRFASSGQGALTYHYLLMVNDIVNVDFSLLKNHPELQWKLLAVCGCGQQSFHPWIAPGKSKKKEGKLRSFLQEIYPAMKNKDIDLIIELNDENELKELARDTGMDEKDIKELFK